MIFGVIPTHTGDDLPRGLNPDTMPNLLCAIIVLASGIKIIQGILKPLQNKNTITVETLFHLAKYFLIMLLIFPAWKYLGFIIGSMSILCLLLIISGERKLVSIIATCIIVVILVYLSAKYILTIPLPYK